MRIKRKRQESWNLILVHFYCTTFITASDELTYFRCHVINTSLPISQHPQRRNEPRIQVSVAPSPFPCLSHASFNIYEILMTPWQTALIHPHRWESKSSWNVLTVEIWKRNAFSKTSSITMKRLFNCLRIIEFCSKRERFRRPNDGYEKQREYPMIDVL